MSDVTQHLGIPLPDPNGVLEEDVLQLRYAFQLIDSLIRTILETLGTDDPDLASVQALVDALRDVQERIAGLSAVIETKADKAEVTALAEGLIRDELTAANSTWSSSKIGQALATLSENLHTVATQIASSKLDKAGGVMTGPILFDQELDLGNTGSAVTIDWRKAHNQRATLTANCTLTFIPPAGVFRGMLKLINSSATARAVTWPVAGRLGGIVPQEPDAKAGAVGLYTVYWDGAAWWISGGRYG